MMPVQFASQFEFTQNPFRKSGSDVHCGYSSGPILQRAYIVGKGLRIVWPLNVFQTCLKVDHAGKKLSTFGVFGFFLLQTVAQPAPREVLRGGIPGTFLEPLLRSWSHFLGIYRQELTRSLKS